MELTTNEKITFLRLEINVLCAELIFLASQTGRSVPTKVQILDNALISFSKTSTGTEKAYRLML